MIEPKFSIIIPTAGRSTELYRCLSSIHKCINNFNDFQVFIIDNNTDQLMSERVVHICSSFPAFNYIFCDIPGLTSARHKALEVTSSEILCFVDDDVIFSDSWFKSTINAFENSNISLVGGPTLPYFSSTVPSWFWDFFSKTPFGGWSCSALSLLDIGHDVHDIDPNWIWGLNFSIKRSVLLDCGGFHLDIVPSQYKPYQGDGETGLTLKLSSKGYKACYFQDSLLYHYCGSDRLNPSYFAKRSYFQGYCNAFTYLRHSILTNSQKKLSLLAFYRIRLENLLRIFKYYIILLLFGSFSKNKFGFSSRKIKLQCCLSEADGFDSFLKIVKASSSLQRWVSKDNYLYTDYRDHA